MAPPRRNALLLICEWLLAFGLGAGGSLLSRLFIHDAGITSIWLANGLMVGLLLHAGSATWMRLLVACALGQAASGMLSGDSLPGVLAASVLIALEVFVAAWLLGRYVASARDLSQPRNFIRFLAAVLLAPLLSGLALAGYQLVTGGLQAHLLESWIAGHALGMATGAPVMLALRGNEMARLFRREHLLEVLLGLAFIVLVTTLVFSQDRYPLLFLIFPPMLLAALRGGFAGTAFALIIVTAIAATLTGLGHGPLKLMSPAPSEFQIYVLLQVFIGVLLLTCFPVAVAMSAWRRKDRSERKLNKLMGVLAEHSSDVIVLTDLDGRRVFVSPSVREVLGSEPEEFLRSTFRELVQPSHFDEVRQQLEQLRHVPGGKGTMTFPTTHADGRGIWLEARMRHFRDADFLDQGEDRDDMPALNRGPSGEEGFVVALRDVSRRRQTEQALEDANRKLASLVLKDSLTGLGNRRFFDHLLAQYWQQCQQSGQPMAVILLDVDYFKLYNDHYGHQQGDQCLREISRVISGSVRGRQASAARYGGEEFAVVVSQAQSGDVERVAERLRSGIERLAIQHAGSPLQLVTASLGVATCRPAAGSSPDALVSAADSALYESKARGRNQVTLVRARANGGFEPAPQDAGEEVAELSRRD